VKERISLKNFGRGSKKHRVTGRGDHVNKKTRMLQDNDILQDGMIDSAGGNV
jgi:hypothetical protein